MLCLHHTVGGGVLPTKLKLTTDGQINFMKVVAVENSYGAKQGNLFNGMLIACYPNFLLKEGCNARPEIFCTVIGLWDFTIIKGILVNLK